MSASVGTGRLEAFSDGVIAVIITIMVLELNAPHEPTFAALTAEAPSFLVYALSFLVVAIMWINHHHLLLHARYASAGLIWSNVFLLFWMSLVPFNTAWLGEHPMDAAPIAVYGADLALCSIGFLLVQSALACQNRDNAASLCFFGRIRIKAAISVTLYTLAALMPGWWPYASLGIFVLIPAAYFWPDPKSELVAEN
jgi:uncharacterized membrane protein